MELDLQPPHRGKFWVIARFTYIFIIYKNIMCIDYHAISRELQPVKQAKRIYNREVKSRNIKDGGADSTY